MTAVTQIAILFCGQGMSTLIEYYAGGNTSAAPDNLVLVDFGGNQKYADSATAYVISKLKMQATPRFDQVIVSHQDGDHLSLLSALTTAIKNAGLTVENGGIYAGGLVWSAANKKKVTEFIDAMEDSGDEAIAFNCPKESNYDEATKRSEIGYLCNFGNTYIRVLVSGVKLSKAPQDITRNASSSFIIVENGTYAVALPGDATYHTLKVVNEYYEGWGAKPLVPRVFTVEVPHHGALRTAVENYTAKTPLAKLDFSIITDFAGYMNTDYIVASAGPYNTHCHPIKEVLDVFDIDLADYEAHTYVAYVFDRKKAKKHDGWEEFDSVNGTLTTVSKVEGGIVYGDQIFKMQDASSTAPATMDRYFQPRGLMNDLMAAYEAGEPAGPRPPNPPHDDILRAPAPYAPPKPRQSVKR